MKKIVPNVCLAVMAYITKEIEKLFLMINRCVCIDKQKIQFKIRMRERYRTNHSLIILHCIFLYGG